MRSTFIAYVLTIFSDAQAKRGASNSLILPEDKEDQGKTSAFFAIESYAFGNSLNLLDSFRVF